MVKQSQRLSMMSRSSVGCIHEWNAPSYRQRKRCIPCGMHPTARRACLTATANGAFLAECTLRIGAHIHPALPHKSPSIPPHKNGHQNSVMSFSLTSFIFALSQAAYLRDRVLGLCELLGRPAFARKAVAARLVKGVRALEAFLRRILILMALDMEPDLIAKDPCENLARAKERKLRARKPFLRIFPAPIGADTFDFREKLGAPRPSEQSPHAATLPPVTVPIGRWWRQLDYLQTIIHDPVKKARRLAFSLARRHPGLLMAPDQNRRVMRGCGTEPTSLFDAMAFQILQKSRSRPPPLPPPRRWPKPMITCL